MKTKLTLRLEEKLIKKAKEHAKSRNTSVSQLVADYLSAIDQPKKKKTEFEVPPLTSELAGIIEGADINEEDYKAHLRDKHLK